MLAIQISFRQSEKLETRLKCAQWVKQILNTEPQNFKDERKPWKLSGEPYFIDDETETPRS